MHLLYNGKVLYILGYKEEEDIEKILDDAEKTIFSVSQSSLGQEFVPVRKALDEAWQRIEKLHAGDGALRGVSTGFPDLDNILGGLQKSDLIVLAARPSLGKTSLALDIATVLICGLTPTQKSDQHKRDRLEYDATAQTVANVMLVEFFPPPTELWHHLIDNLHLSEEGHRIYAEGVASCLNLGHKSALAG